MEKSATTVVSHSHYVGITGGSHVCHAELCGANAVRPAVVEDETTVGVIADKANGFERNGRAKLRKILEDVVRRAAVSRGLRDDVGQRILWRPCVDYLYMVNYPIATGKESLTHT
jgi:hypothetical protein